MAFFGNYIKGSVSVPLFWWGLGCQLMGMECGCFNHPVSIARPHISEAIRIHWPLRGWLPSLHCDTRAHIKVLIWYKTHFHLWIILAIDWCTFAAWFIAFKKLFWAVWLLSGYVLSYWRIISILLFFFHSFIHLFSQNLCLLSVRLCASDWGPKDE